MLGCLPAYLRCPVSPAGSSSILGKPALNDMRSGLATAPVLLAAEEQPALLPLIQRKFKREGDVERALELMQVGRLGGGGRVLWDVRARAWVAAMMPGGGTLRDGVPPMHPTRPPDSAAEVHADAAAARRC
jgi:hypothetical protein